MAREVARWPNRFQTTHIQGKKAVMFCLYEVMETGKVMAMYKHEVHLDTLWLTHRVTCVRHVDLTMFLQTT